MTSTVQSSLTSTPSIEPTRTALSPCTSGSVLLVVGLKGSYAARPFRTPKTRGGCHPLNKSELHMPAARAIVAEEMHRLSLVLDYRIEAVRPARGTVCQRSSDRTIIDFELVVEGSHRVSLLEKRQRDCRLAAR